MELMEGKEVFKFIKNDREKVFNNIVLEFSDRIYNLAKLYTKDEHLSQDITQETLIKIYRYLDSFNGNSNIYTWIYRITINTCKNSIIKENKYRSIEDISFIKDEGYEDKIIERLQEGKLLEALGNIKKEYSSVLYLYYYDDLKIKEISEIMGKREGTIKTWLRRGKDALEKELLKYEKR
ncbi:sigma-70 family RNA polymerase sigma factor [Clostridium thermobutyricum]|uniref:RNA polymerase sigma factor n=1 Tax=Clostridium thermobutyricum TaxID=29372 RepID=N9XUG4_9CLOT|nr:sigma-70 family RNA polymerase sigma factor [Clostridium thermobutyricum]ENZ03348.1 sigma-70 family RNA polymerase sigma factor [Clostridium thermobutyricum]